MNISSLINGFTSYLEGLNESSGKNYNTDSSNVSIFMYSSEFKNYISEELNVDASIFSKSVSDILNMEVVNGKLVDKEEETNSDTFTSEEQAPNNETDQDILETDDEPQTPEAANTENIDGNTSGEAAESVKTGENAQNADAMSEILNNLFEDSNIIKALDTDKSGDLNKDEIGSFFESIKGKDGNIEDISLEDILSGLDSIKTDLETKNNSENPAEENEQSMTDNEEAKATTEATEQPSSEIPAPVSTGGNTGGGYVPSVSNPSSNNVKKEDLKNLTLPELQEKYSEAEAERNTKKSEYNETKTSSEEAISDSKEAEEQAYNTYIEELKKVEDDDEKFAEQEEELNTQITDKEEEIHTRKTEISDKKNDVTEAQNAFDTAKSTFESLDAALSQLQSTDTGDMDDEQKADLSAKIAALQAERDAAEKAMNEAEEKLNSEKEALDKLENGGDGTKSLADLETELTDLETQLTELEAQILEAHPEIQEYLTEYQDAREEHSNTINEADKAIEKAQQNLDASQNKLQEINAAIKNLETKETIKENSVDPLSQYNSEEGNKLIETAKQMLAKYGSTTGLCATGVSRTFSMAYGIQMGGNGCDWDTNMEKLVNQGMFAEVTDNYPSSGDLSSLPAGAVVCWEATTGTGGGGAEYGHVTVADGNGGEISDHYAANIYKSIGGRSDNYRVFIPV